VYVKANPQANIPSSLLQGKDFLRRLQGKLFLLPLSKESKRKPRATRNPAVVLVGVYNTSSNEENKMWD